jgi:hypothetical protein
MALWRRRDDKPGKGGKSQALGIGHRSRQFVGVRHWQDFLGCRQGVCEGESARCRWSAIDWFDVGAEMKLGSAVAGLILSWALFASTSVYAQACRVLDPELAGSYSGGCRDGLADGYGQARGMAIYTGEYRAGRKHGKGIKRWPWGEQYEGDFVEDRKQGFGTYTWSLDGPWSGEKYIGAFSADSREGVGTYTWPTGEVYAGTWSQDQIAGPVSPDLLDKIAAHARADAEAMAAVGRPGVRVCRLLRIGIGTEDWISGEVVEAKGFAISIRIENPGRFSATLNGVNLSRGAVIWDTAPSWIPCR